MIKVEAIFYSRFDDCFHACLKDVYTDFYYTYFFKSLNI